MMIKCGPRAIKKFTSLAYNQFEMHVVILVAFIGNKGDSSITI